MALQGKGKSMGLLTKSALVFSLVLLAIQADAAAPPRPVKMTFSYVDHPAMVNFLIPLVRDSYQKLGIQTDFVAQPSNRNLLLVDKNIVDGDVGYMRIVLEGYPNLISIEPPLVSGIYTLLCQPGLRCEPEVLADASQTIVTTSVSKNGLEKGYRAAIHSQFYVVNDLAMIPKFVSSGRFHYAIYPSTEQELQRLDPAELQYVTLFEASLYHVLHKKYSFMADDVSQAFKQTLQERKARERRK